MEQIKYRHEYKYLVHASELGFLDNQAKSIMKIDTHAKDGIYNIRSLYFDDMYNSCFFDNQNGNEPREKYRIRIYNHSKDKISLECKKKERGKTLKSSCSLTIEQCKDLMNGRVVDDYLNQDFLIKKICAKILNDRLKPSIIIEYDRKPYINKDGNVRVTFDTNISSSNYTSMFLEDDIPKRHIMPKGLDLLEVKYDDFLPDTIYNTLQLEKLNWTAFSKFYLGRIYELGMNINFDRED